MELLKLLHWLKCWFRPIKSEILPVPCAKYVMPALDQIKSLDAHYTANITLLND